MVLASILAYALISSETATWAVERPNLPPLQPLACRMQQDFGLRGRIKVGVSGARQRENKAMVPRATVASAGEPLTVRRAQLDVALSEPTPLGGYTERQNKPAEPGGDRLFSRVILLQKGNVRIAVVSAEMLTIPESLTREVKKQIPPDVHLFLAATHTHCAPDSQMYNDRMTLSIPGIASFKRRKLEEAARQIASSVNVALAAPAETPRKWWLGVGHLDRTHARRPQDRPDQSLTRLDADGTPLLWQYAAHPVFYDSDELKTRGDWPGALASKAGGLVLQGAIGDVSPNMDKRPPAAQIADFVKDCQTTRFKPISLGAPNASPALGWAEQPIALGPKIAHPGFAAEYKVPEALAQLAVNQFAPSTASVSALRIGKVALVGIPGEPTAAIGRRIRDAGRRMGFSVVLVTSHVNGWIGYILEPDDYDRGGYEATLAMHGRDACERVVEASVKALAKLARP
jgi:neutral ceramidase